jgi:hypothetical protein
MEKTVRPPLTRADARAYVAGGGTCCPYCRHEEITGGASEVGASGAWQEVHCDRCGARWRDAYTLTGIDVLDVRGRYQETLDGTSGP